MFNLNSKWVYIRVYNNVIEMEQKHVIRKDQHMTIVKTTDSVKKKNVTQSTHHLTNESALTLTICDWKPKDFNDIFYALLFSNLLTQHKY